MSNTGTATPLLTASLNQQAQTFLHDGPLRSRSAASHGLTHQLIVDVNVGSLSSRTRDADELLAQIDVGRKYLLNSLAALARRPTRSDNADRYRTFPEVCALP